MYIDAEKVIASYFNKKQRHLFKNLQTFLFNNNNFFSKYQHEEMLQSKFKDKTNV